MCCRKPCNQVTRDKKYDCSGVGRSRDPKYWHVGAWVSVKEHTANWCTTYFSTYMWTLRAWYISKSHAWRHKTATFDNLKEQCPEKFCSDEALKRLIRPDRRPHQGFTFSWSAVQKLRRAFNCIQYQSADCSSFWKTETGFISRRQTVDKS